DRAATRRGFRSGRRPIEASRLGDRTGGDDDAAGRRGGVRALTAKSSDSYDGLGQGGRANGPVEGGVTIVEDPSIGGDLPVAAGVGRRCGPNEGLDEGF